MRAPPFTLDQIRRRASDVHGSSRSDTREELVRRRSRDLSLEDLLDVIGQAFAAPRCAPHQFAMKTIGYIAHLNHSGHVQHMLAHVLHMLRIQPTSTRAGMCKSTAAHRRSLSTV